MVAASPARRILARLEPDVAQAFEGREHVVLAYSGGLGSLILAAVARKHGDIRCVVVGMRGAADAEAARLAKLYLDYPVDVLQPSEGELLRVARDTFAARPRLPPADVLRLLPLVLVERAHPEDLVLSGFGLALRSAPLDRRLVAAGSHLPGGRRARAAAASRPAVFRAAQELGIPDAFALAPHREPAEGSGIGPALRAMGHARHASVARLLETSA